MRQMTHIADVHQWRWSQSDQVVLVPTMGALHEGHLALIRQARAIVGPSGKVVLSLFVNPLQFGANEDLSRYPQPFARDLMLCEQEGVDLLFHPSPEEMYPPGTSIKIDERDLSLGLCGASRPGHFSGVITVVTKLFNMIAPQVSLFGEKDWQQLAVIRRLVRDLNFPIEIVGHPIVREPDGLAMSSRNTYLSAEERRSAPAIYQTLMATAAAVKEGITDVAQLLVTTRERLTAIPHATIDYVEIVHGITLQPLVTVIPKSPTRLLVAVKMGGTRLLDNIELVVS